MARKVFPILLAVALLISWNFNGSQNAFAKDPDLKPEQVVAAHLKSIGNPELLASIKNRGVGGDTIVNFIQGGTGKMIGQSLILSDGPSLAVILKYGTPDYPGEHFAFNGSEVTVANMSPGQRSPLGDFIYRYNIILKEGLFGGVLSVGWPLLDIAKKNPSLKYDREKVDGRELHVLEYMSKQNMNDVKVKLFFDLETFRHVRTEYRLKVQGEQSLQANDIVVAGVPRATNSGARTSPDVRNAGITEAIEDSHYALIETFDNFKQLKSGKGPDAKSLTLPQSYTISYSNQGHGSTFLGNWTVDAKSWYQNGKIDQSYFKVQ
jgi:hypothetical protein